MGDQRGFVDRRVAGRLDERPDRFAEALVGHADDGGVGDYGVQLEDLLDLLRVDLLATGVDALAAPAEEAHGAIGIDGRPVTRHRVAHPVDRAERGRRLVRVLVVAERHRAGHRDETGFPGPGHDVDASLGDHPRVLGELERRRRRRGFGGRRAGGHADRFRRPQRVDEDQPIVVAQESVLGLLRPHHAGRDDHPQRRDVPATGLGIEGAQDRSGEGVANDRHRLHPLAARPCRAARRGRSGGRRE